MAAGIYPRAERVFRPWKNGGGTTAELLAAPAGSGFDDFDWRISTARVEASGPFSLFPGVDRVLTVLEGGAIALEIAGVRHALDADSAPFTFPGDVPCFGHLDAGPLLDLNVMVRRPWTAEVRRGPLDARATGLALLLEDAGGLSRLDLVDLAAADPALVQAITGAAAVAIAIRAGNA
ncbi:MAG: HutD family protein [Amaricoccus sp.]